MTQLASPSPEATPVPPRGQFGRRSSRIWLAAGLSAGVILIALLTWPDKPKGASVNTAGKAAASQSTDVFQPTPSQWAALRFAPVRDTAFRDERATDGKIGINEDTTTPVYSPYSGRVSRLIAKPGDFVQKGAPLFAIEASEFVQGQNDLVSAVAALEKAKAKLVLSVAAEKRQRELLAIRGGAMKDLEAAQSDLVAANGDVRSAEISLAAVRNRLRILGRSDAEIEKLEKADSVAAETIVDAPIEGTVLQRKVGLGQYINAGATTDPVFTIGNLSKVWLIANVRESDAPFMRVGAPVEVSVLAYPGRTFSARLTYVAPSLDPNTRRLAVRAEIDNSKRELLPEMFASFRIVTGDPRKFPAVPENAVVYEGASARVWVADTQNKSVVARSIQTGVTAGGLVEVVNGLRDGEEVVTSGPLFIDRAAARD